MSEVFYQHKPVLLNEAVESLVQVPHGIYVDATFGRGNHTQAILQRLNQQGRVIAFDKDQEAFEYGKNHFAKDQRFTILHGSFVRLQMMLTHLEVFGKVDGILFDLGVSSPQLDDASRGFSFTKAGPLDMRMDQTQGIRASDWLMSVDEVTLAKVLWEYGEERFSRRIAKAIIAARETAPITDTLQLAEIIKRAVPKGKKPYDKHPATKSFQAIRISVNQELIELQKVLIQALAALTIGGRLAVISFHSLEDRIVKQFIHLQAKGEPLPRGLPIKGAHFNPRLKPIGKPIKASLQEVNINPRARSAILRIAEKIS